MVIQQASFFYRREQRIELLVAGPPRTFSSSFVVKQSVVTGSVRSFQPLLKKEFTTIHAVKDEEMFHMSFLRGYPDSDLNCIKDYGVGASRLSTADINKHTTSLNCEWKRRMEFATSFTAASMSALAKLAENVSLADGSCFCLMTTVLHH